MNVRYLLTPYFIAEPVPGLEALAGPGWQLNAPPLPAGDPQSRMIALYRPLAQLVAETVGGGDLPVSVAGDCLSSMGVLAGLQQAGLNPTLLWFDAHGDFNTWETTPSGFLGGMPLAMLVGRGEQTMVKGLALARLSEAQVVLTDARDLDPGEREAVAGSAMLHLPDPAVLLDEPLPDGPLYVHFDTDVLNPEEAPAMHYRADGGPSAATLRRIFRRLAGSGRVVAVSMSAWAPELDAGGRSRAVCMSLLEALLP